MYWSCWRQELCGSCKNLPPLQVIQWYYWEQYHETFNILKNCDRKFLLKNVFDKLYFLTKLLQSHDSCLVSVLFIRTINITQSTFNDSNPLVCSNQSYLPFHMYSILQMARTPVTVTLQNWDEERVLKLMMAIEMHLPRWCAFPYITHITLVRLCWIFKCTNTTVPAPIFWGFCRPLWPKCAKNWNRYMVTKLSEDQI